jgi:hypothetical protein
MWNAFRKENLSLWNNVRAVADSKYLHLEQTLVPGCFPLW